MHAAAVEPTGSPSVKAASAPTSTTAAPTTRERIIRHEAGADQNDCS